MDQARYLIDELCRLTGFSRRTVRYYVQEGLVDPPAGRGRGGYYSDLHAAQLARIRALQEQGYRLDAIRTMIAPRGEASAADTVRAPAPAPDRRDIPGSAWTRHVVAPGVELHVSAGAASRFGPAISAALEAVRSLIRHEGGLHE
jgi:DNA-binding transcriptional MerR regulator